ncbi:hypothetical protein GCM10025867_51450 (plasmid) [Frondihabitans sucicola]|uniref:Uncharacterized protein n=1 Tax=Frondihabitans sucicola TaxID=1268041 RepID=A0ABM8GV32_9MICO|nr:hypothetical protein [Frondihabitans sucicola]BDZ52337.1 hypothetical protein GCM10025867_45780 [Frondihabitans sucicola]BDZ52904.1 hypothetical protein GCM10025867_51450 [Frondihabitans sucicola]
MTGILAPHAAFDVDAARERHEELTAELLERMRSKLVPLGRLALNAGPEERRRLFDKQAGLQEALDFALGQEGGWVGIFWALTKVADSIPQHLREGWGLAISYAAEGFRLS